MSKLVAVWSSDPTYGDPYEGVFYMKPPYHSDQLLANAENRTGRWVKKMALGGMKLTTRPDLRGPFKFGSTERRDMSEDRREDDEWVIVAWYKREKPIEITTEEYDRRRQLALRYGMTPRDPAITHRENLQPLGVVATPKADEMGTYIDPSGRDASGNSASDYEALGLKELAHVS